MKTIFLAHAKDADSEQLKQQLKQKLKDPYIITTGFEDYEARYKTCGSWVAWTTSVGQGKLMGVPRYDAFIVPFIAGDKIGRATMQIITGALALGKPCRAWDTARNVFVRISSVKVVDAENWTSGWTFDLPGVQVKLEDDDYSERL